MTTAQNSQLARCILNLSQAYRKCQIQRHHQMSKVHCSTSSSRQPVSRSLVVHSHSCNASPLCQTKWKFQCGSTQPVLAIPSHSFHSSRPFWSEKEKKEQEFHPPHPSVMERLKTIDERTRLYGYSMLKIGLATVAVGGLIIYFFRDGIRRRVAGEVTDVATRSLSDAELQARAEHLSKALLHEILSDTEMQRQTERESNIHRAKMAQLAGKFNEMAMEMKAVCEMDVKLTYEERNLLSIAFEHLLSPKRAFYRDVIDLQENENKPKTAVKLWTESMTVREEVCEVCQEVIGLLDEHVIPFVSDAESEIFYYRMKGDYYRYMAEVLKGQTGEKEIVKNGLDAYTHAVELAKKQLPPTNETRLVAFLNLCVFYYEILDLEDLACGLCLAVYGDVVANLKTIPQDRFEEIKPVLRLYELKLALWTSRMAEEYEE